MAEVSPLRRRMIADMTIRNLSPATQQSYIDAVAKFSRHYGRSPDRLRESWQKRVQQFNMFGELWSVPGSPEIVMVSNVTEDGRPIGVRRAGENWHSDMCCAARPLRGTTPDTLEIPNL